jgi:hypothetical protein
MSPFSESVDLASPALPLVVLAPRLGVRGDSNNARILDFFIDDPFNDDPNILFNRTGFSPFVVPSVSDR